MPRRTEGQVLQDVTQEYLDNLDRKNLPTVYDCVGTLMGMTVDEYEAENANKPKNQKWPIPRDLQNIQLAMLVADLFPICCIACAGQDSDPEYDMLGIYQTQGSSKGLYVTGETSFRVVIQQFKPTLKYKDFLEVLSLIRTIVPRRFRCTEPDLIAVNNGVFDYKTKQLYPFSHKLVFLSKSKVNYDKYATNVVIHNDDDDTDWDVESWMQSLSDDPEVVELIWEILGAIIRPHVRWNKSAWFYSETGNNGKGTLCELMRELCGPGTYTSIPLSSFSKDFMLEPLTHSTAIIVDENDVGTYIDKAANLKAVITNDVLQINRKNKEPISYQFYGFMVQCLNELPKIKDAVRTPGSPFVFVVQQIGPAGIIAAGFPQRDVPLRIGVVWVINHQTGLGAAHIHHIIAQHGMSTFGSGNANHGDVFPGLFEILHSGAEGVQIRINSII